MKQTGISKRFFAGVLLLTVIVIVITRGVTLTYNRQLHPDEHVFYLSANSLLNSILHPEMEFIEHKEYPEGAHCFYAVFHLIGRVVGRLTGAEQDLQIWGRVAAVSYFTAAVLLGIRIVGKYLGRTRYSVVLYALTMCFSLFFIEQSRYGVGDPISLLLLMIIINLTARAAEPNAGWGWWLASFLICGVLGAVKYPLIVFTLIPLCTYFCYVASEGKPKIFALVGIFACLAGFLLFSPKGLLDPGYFLRVIRFESDAYVTTGTAHEAGGVLNHLVAMLLYSILYSDFPILLPFMAWGIFNLWKDGKEYKTETTVEFLFYKVIPGVCIFFFVYNLFVTLLFFRTYTPFFGIITLYTSAFAGHLFEQKGVKRIVVVCLSAFMVLRGSLLVCVLSDDSTVEDSVEQQLQTAIDTGVDDTYVLSLWALGPHVVSDQDLSISSLDQLLADNAGMEIQPGQLVVTGSWGFHAGHPYILPASQSSQKPIDDWQAFQSVNESYLIGQAYPEEYYYLFGGWIRGGTLSKYELPVNYIYYRSK